LQRNPQLPQSPLGAYTDAQYQAQDAILRSNIAKQYSDILQQLGYVDPNSGGFIQGSVEANANKSIADQQRQMQLADEQVTQQHQTLGTLFSGLRGTDQARAEEPMVSSIANTQTQTPLTLQQLYEQAAGLTSDYTNQQNSNIADAASRASAALQAQPPAAAPAPFTGPGDIQTAPTAPTAPALSGHYDPNRGIYVQGPAPAHPYVNTVNPVNPPNSMLVKPVAPGRVTIGANGQLVVH
jgi:hypothetical protein